MEWLEDFFDKTGSVLQALPELFTIIGEETRNLGIGIADAVCDHTIPLPGSVIICKLAGGLCEHSGIYIGNNRIVELNGDGTVQALSIYQFQTASLLRTGFSAYVACNCSGHVLSDSLCAARAEKMIQKHWEYAFLSDNCHRFTCGCISGDFANGNTFLWMLERELQEKYHCRKIIWERI